jgi:hypothetical protein
MPTLMTFVLRLVLLVAGLLFAASLAVAFVLMLCVWTLRAAWARLTGRPVVPFVIRIDPRGGFERMYRGAGQGGRTPRANAVRRGQEIADVTDVEPRPPTP